MTLQNADTPVSVKVGFQITVHRPAGPTQSPTHFLNSLYGDKYGSAVDLCLCPSHSEKCADLIRNLNLDSLVELLNW